MLTIGKVGILWKLNRVTGQYEDCLRAVFQNVFDKIDPKTGIPTYRKDVQAAKIGEWISSCPGPAGGHDWPATSYDPKTDLMIIPLHQSCVLMRAEPMEENRRGRRCRLAASVRDAGHRRQSGQAGGL